MTGSNLSDLRPTLLSVTTQTTNYPLETKSQELTKINTSLMIQHKAIQEKTQIHLQKPMLYLEQKNTPKQPLNKDLSGK